ncbi:hypothetical protein [Kribbella sp. DT2]|uniref:hypothetical protein n=1 Tax=Kribbella sp. DT2 TaxID=3393427 RepID=UPI003CEE4F1D
MPMRTLMTGTAPVSYAQIYVESSNDSMPELSQCFAGQQNGLCGAVAPGTLFLITGLHTGDVGFTVELHDEEPPVDDTWEEIVEASYRPRGEVALNSWGGEASWPLELDLVNYRLRYSGSGLEAGRQAAPQLNGEPPVDHYLLQFWPAPPAPDRVVKQTSTAAAYWHGFAQETPPPPTPEQRAELQQERERQKEIERQAEELAAWGGTLPSERLQEIWKAFHLASDYRELLDAADAAPPDTQWEIARWITRSMCVEADLAQLDWITATLDRLDNGHENKWEILQIPAEAFDPPLTDGVRVTSGGWNPNADQAAQATALFSAFLYDDPLRAVVDTLWVARDVYGPARAQAFLDDLWSDFPTLRGRG